MSGFVAMFVLWWVRGNYWYFCGRGEVLAVSVRERRGSKAQIDYK